MITSEMAAAMAADTRIEIDIDEPDRIRAVVRSEFMAESDPAFYLDVDWLAWFAANPHWSMQGDLEDDPDPAVTWAVAIARRPAR